MRTAHSRLKDKTTPRKDDQNTQQSIPRHLLSAGSIKGKVPVPIPELRMVAFVDEGVDPTAVRRKYLGKRDTLEGENFNDVKEG